MKEYTFSKESWHYKMCLLGDSDFKWKAQHMDMCEYIRVVIGKLITLALGAILLLFLAGATLLSWYDLFAWLFFDADFHKSSVAMWIVQVGLLIIAGLIAIKVYFDNREVEGKEPSFITVAYRKFKDKTCSKVNFE